MADYDYDLVVIGTGPAGEAAAINGQKALFEHELQPIWLALKREPYVI